MELNSIKGIGPKKIEDLNKLGIFNNNDLLRYYPFRYNIYTPMNINEIEESTTITITGIVDSQPKLAFIPNNKNIISFYFTTNNVRIRVSIFNRQYLIGNIHITDKITLVGRYDRLTNTFSANMVKLYELTKTELEPVYHTVSGIKSNLIIRSINKSLEQYTKVNEIIPEYIIKQYKLIDNYNAIKEIHNPTTLVNLKQAKLKLKYEELFEFMFKINILKQRKQLAEEYNIKKVIKEDYVELKKSIPFTLTEDQDRAVLQILKDFNNKTRMNRLVLGDVGSGKTIIAFIALLLNKKAGYQGVLLAPTEVLANQHYNNFKEVFPNANIELLTGSTKNKNEIKEKLLNNKIDILIGTHAVIEDNVKFSNLGLVVTDEQHRFGVNQREYLENKGNKVDVLYLSATPIPRTYALTIYGDMEITEIKQKPSGRKPIITEINKFDEIEITVDKINETIKKNQQVYIVSSVIETDETSELQDLKDIKALITPYLKGNPTIDFLHGKMKNVEKDKVMNKFKNNETNILISTTVIEVGVDVKNATLMVIMNAERFGLSTLHQLRGRVGRNDVQSYCVLVSNQESERLKVLTESNDGFYISKKDFELRGSGDIFGIRQSGDMSFKISDLRTDMRILEQCKKDTLEFIEKNKDTNFIEYPYFRYIKDELLK